MTSSLFFYCFATFLLLAPLYKAGYAPLPLLLLELAAIGLLFVIVAVHRAPLTLPRMLAAAIGVLLVYPLVQLIPMPAALWRILPGHAEYASVIERFGTSGEAGMWRPISVVPSATVYGWLPVLPPLACLLAVLRLSTTHVARLLLMMAIFVGAEALLGLLQVGPGGRGFLYFGNEEPGQYVAIGTFVNKNHFAAMLAMTLPVIIGLLVYIMRPGSDSRLGPRNLVASEAVAQGTLLFAAAVMILVCLLFTRSRAGIASGLIGLVCSAVVLVRARVASVGTSPTRVASYVVIALVGMSVLAALMIGVAPILSGLEPGQLQSGADFRWRIYKATLRAAIEFLPFGSGLSTFADVFPRFQEDIGIFTEYAHNDYLQAFMELGVAAPVIAALSIAAWGTRMLELLRAEDGRSFTLLQLGAGLGMLPMILHTLFDFALHMPADAMWFATLTGVLFHKGVGPGEHVDDNMRKPAQDELLRPGASPPPP